MRRAAGAPAQAAAAAAGGGGPAAHIAMGRPARLAAACALLLAALAARADAQNVNGAGISWKYNPLIVASNSGARSQAALSHA